MKKIKFKKIKSKKAEEKRLLKEDMVESAYGVIFNLTTLYFFKESMNEGTRMKFRSNVYNMFNTMPMKTKNKRYSEKFIRENSWGIYDGKIYGVIVDAITECSFDCEVKDLTIAEVINKIWNISSHYFDWLVPELANNGLVNEDDVINKLIKMGL